VTTWADHDAMDAMSKVRDGLPDPPIWAKARTARKGWAEEPGHIVRGDLPIEAMRFYRRQGAAFSGWIVREIFGNGYLDPLPTKAEALAALLAWNGQDPS